ncbi:MAG: hypothetical protein HY730_09910, partial [Candidatus Tectomicrobia bacterium]|nr:hypothetical protein [Candidatus Tectomicrobia bacterium]
MLARLIQQKVPLGSRVSFSLGSGNRISGVLIELGHNHVTVENENGQTIIPIDRIDALIPFKEVISGNEPENAGEQTLETSEGAGNEAKSVAIKERVITPISSGIQAEVFKKVLEIEARYQANLNTAKIELKIPDFLIPPDEAKRWEKTDAVVIWNRIKDRYEYAS